jgi:DNA-directed RNA polymerase II subunit RPB2
MAFVSVGSPTKSLSDIL